MMWLLRQTTGLRGLRYVLWMSSLYRGILVGRKAGCEIVLPIQGKAIPYTASQILTAFEFQKVLE
jgi:hypothetical protein